MTDSTSPELTKSGVLALMHALWDEFDALLVRFGDKLDTRMPIPAPSWSGRQFMGHLLGSLQSTPYYLMQPRGGAPIEGVIGDPYWRQIYETATMESFRAMLFAAHVGIVKLVELSAEADLQRISPFMRGGETGALEMVHFIYDFHLRSHMDDMRKWLET